MPKWRVHVSYWSGFTKDREWHESARNLFEGQGWIDIRFWNPLVEPGFVPWSSGVDADEIDFTVNAEQADREAVPERARQPSVGVAWQTHRCESAYNHGSKGMATACHHRIEIGLER